MLKLRPLPLVVDWNDFELSLLRTHGFTPVTMGPRTLTTTTACIALLTLVHSCQTG